jgi:uncharacterized phiE125 gp8 family phage protein
MMLSEVTPISTAALPLQAMKDHLRLGSGFADDGLQDGLVEAYLRAAMAAIEGRIGKALLTRRFRMQLEDWRWAETQTLPVAPVSSIVSVSMIDGAGVPTAVDPARYRLVADMHRPKLASTGSALPSVPTNGSAEISFDAGFGAAWSDVPSDLRQAVLMLAAEYYENRNDMGLRDAGLPYGIMALIERWRTVRVLGGGGS